VKIGWITLAGANVTELFNLEAIVDRAMGQFKLSHGIQGSA
jgi:hypothetical protein